VKAPQRIPPRDAPQRAGWLVVAVVASLALHGAVLAAMVLWPRAEPADTGAEGAVALVFADIVDPGGAGAAANEVAPPEPPAPPEAVALPPAPPPVPPLVPPPAVPDAVRPPVAQAAPPPPPMPAPTVPEAGPPVADGILPPPPPPEPAAPAPQLAEAPPPEPAREAPPPTPEAALPVPPQPPAEPQPEPTAPVQTAAAAPRPPRPARPPAASGPMRLDAGIGALPDPSFGAQAMGAVVPPGTESGRRNAPPDYPAESRRRGEEGVVRLALRVGIDGRVEDAQVATSSGFPRLDQAAVEAARRWRFRPATQGGLPVAATLPTAVHFRLTDARAR
jgi:protein TonB